MGVVDKTKWGVIRADIVICAPVSVISLLQSVNLQTQYAILSNTFSKFEWMLLAVSASAMDDETIDRAVGVSDAAQHVLEDIVDNLGVRGRLTPEAIALAEGLLRRIGSHHELDVKGIE